VPPAQGDKRAVKVQRGGGEGAVEAWAAQRGLRCLTLDVAAANARARALHARLGHRTEEIRLTKGLSPSSA
jgi:RimJ/RimL family protein N-acetyltransferase